MADTVPYPLPTVAPPPTMAPAIDPLLGVDLAGYVVERELAAGGMGVLYEARHRVIARRAAVKVMKPDFARGDWASWFLSEAKALSAVKHGHIVEILNFGTLPDGRQYLMMELLEGETLEAYLAWQRTLSIGDALNIADEILQGLDAAHRAGVVHRDLKPANVFLVRQTTGERLVKLVDFGLARSRGTNELLLAGTPDYISPEQINRGRIDPPSDFYSLGVMLFQMLSGRLPFRGDTAAMLMHMHCHVAPPRLGAVRPDVWPELEDFVASLLAKECDARPRSATAARATVKRLLRQMESRITQQEQHPAPVPVPRPTQRRWRLLGALAVMPLLAGAAWWSSQAPSSLVSRAAAAVVLPRPLALVAPAAPIDAELPPLPPPKPVVQRVATKPPACAADAGWARGATRRIAELEAKALSRLPLDASLAQVNAVKERSRNLLRQSTTSAAASCGSVDRELEIWAKQLLQ